MQLYCAWVSLALQQALRNIILLLLLLLLLLLGLLSQTLTTIRLNNLSLDVLYTYICTIL